MGSVAIPQAYRILSTKLIAFEVSTSKDGEITLSEDSFVLDDPFVLPLEEVKPIKVVYNIALKDLKVGDKCISAIGNDGVITEVDRSFNGKSLGQIVINWVTGRKSILFYENDGLPWADKVEYIGQ